MAVAGSYIRGVLMSNHSLTFGQGPAHWAYILLSRLFKLYAKYVTIILQCKVSTPSKATLIETQHHSIPTYHIRSAYQMTSEPEGGG